MKTHDFFYELPPELIAQHPLDRRDASRLLVLNEKREMLDRHFSDLPQFLRPGDCLVLNNTKVIPARLLGQRADTGSPVELLLLERKEQDDWDVIVRPGRKCRVGHRLVFIPNVLEAEIVAVQDNGNRIARFSYDGVWEELLDLAGTMPLPPYIHEKLADPERYQTVYAKHDGSAAAPTAGLHFTPDMLDRLRISGIETAELTLHVGLGTFRPVKCEDILDHPMHHEYYCLDEAAVQRINDCRAAGGRIIAVGTTVCRVLETLAAAGNGTLAAGSGYTNLFIYPGFRFRILDGLITNFHLPESTLLMLVCAFYGQNEVLAAYRHAIAERYRFFSFGDAMMLLPPRGEI